MKSIVDGDMKATFVHNLKTLTGMASLTDEFLVLSPKTNSEIRIPLASVSRYTVKSKSSIEIVFYNFRRIVLSLNNSNLQQIELNCVLEEIAANPKPPFETTDNRYDIQFLEKELSRQGYQHEVNLLRVSSPLKGRPAIVPFSIAQENIEALSSFYWNGQFPQYVWGNWSSSSQLYGSMLFHSSRPLHFISKKEGTKNSFTGTLATDYMSHLLFLLNDSRFKREEDRAVTVLDVGPPCQEIVAAFPEIKFKFYNLSEKETECNFSNLENLCINEIQDIQDSITKMNSTLRNLLYKYLIITNEIIQTFKSCPLVILSSAGKGYSLADVILKSLLLILLDSHYRTLDGFLSFVIKEWNIASTGSIWVHFSVFIYCVFILYTLNPDAFEFNEHFLMSLLDNTHLSETKYMNEIFTAQREYFSNSHHDPLAVPIHWHINSDFMVWFPYFFRYQPQISTYRREIMSSIKGSLMNSTGKIFEKRLSIRRRNLIWFSVISLFKPLESLSITDCMLAMVPTEISHLTNLVKLNLDNNLLGMVPCALRNLSSLRVLSLNRNRIFNIPASISSMALEELFLDGNEISNITEICKLTQLRLLSLQANKISKLPTQFRNLSKLNSLNLAENELKQIHYQIIECLTEMKTLILTSNKLTSIPDRFSKWKNLSTLFLKSNALATVPPSLENCPSLTYLDVSFNRLKHLDDVKLLHLKRFDLSWNKIKTIPFWLYQLVNLKSLNMESNKLETMGHTLCYMTSLKELNLAKNRIRTLPPTMGNLVDSLKSLDVTDNPLEPELQNLLPFGTHEILSSLHQTLHSTRQVLRMKLVLLGKTNVGKTSLVECLGKKWNKSNTLSTGSNQNLNSKKQNANSIDGIDITSFDFQRTFDHPKIIKKNKKSKHTVSIDVWDFAGQELYYASHQFFLSSRAIYMLVVHIKSEDVEEEIEFWHRSIKARVRNPKIIVVATHLDTCDKAYENVFITNLKKKWKTISFFGVSCVSEENIGLLRNSVEEMLCSDLQLVKTIPFSCLHLEQLLKEYSEGLAFPIINRTELMKIGYYCNLLSQNDLISCTRLLHELGKVIYFDKIPKLKDLVILNPKWLIEVMSTIFTTKHRWIKTGLISLNSLKLLWKEYPPEIHDHLLVLLEKFEIAFVLKNFDCQDKKPDLDISLSEEETLQNPEEEFVLIVPLLPTDKPHTALEKYWGVSTDSESFYIQRLYQFSILPEGLFSRMIIRVLQSSTKNLIYWSRGVVSVVTHNGVDVKLYLEYLSERTEDADQPEARETISLQLISPKALEGQIVFCDIIDKMEEVVATWPKLKPARYAKILLTKPFIEQSTPLPKKVPSEAMSTPSMRRAETPLLKKPRERMTVKILSVVNQLVDIDIIRNDAIKGLESINVGGLEVSIESIAPDLTLPMFKGTRFNYQSISIKKPLGDGGFATVYYGLIKDDVPVAVKALSSTPKNNEMRLRDLRHEVCIHGPLDDPNITSVLGICLDPLCIILEYCDFGDLYHLIHDWINPIHWQLRVELCLDVAKALKYLQSQPTPIAHLDLKSPNVLLKKNKDNQITAKLADFGSAKYVTSPLLIGEVDNPLWLSPERIQLKEYDQRSDIYSFGIICWELLTRNKVFGEIPFMAEIQEKIVAGERPVIPGECPPKFRKIIETSWHQDVNSRPHPEWIISELESIHSIYDVSTVQFIEQSDLLLKQLKEEQDEMEDILPPHNGDELVIDMQLNQSQQFATPRSPSEVVLTKSTSAVRSRAKSDPSMLGTFTPQVSHSNILKPLPVINSPESTPIEPRSKSYILKEYNRRPKTARNPKRMTVAKPSFLNQSWDKPSAKNQEVKEYVNSLPNVKTNLYELYSEIVEFQSAFPESNENARNIIQKLNHIVEKCDMEIIEKKSIDKLNLAINSGTVSSKTFDSLLCEMKLILEIAKLKNQKKTENKKKSPPISRKKIIPLNLAPITEDLIIPDFSTIFSAPETFSSFFLWLPSPRDQLYLKVYKELSEIISENIEIISPNVTFEDAKGVIEVLREAGFGVEFTENDFKNKLLSIFDEIFEKLYYLWLLYNLQICRQSPDILVEFCRAVQYYKQSPSEKLAQAIGSEYLGMNGSKAIPVQEALVGDVVRRIRNGSIKKDLFKKIVEEITKNHNPKTARHSRTSSHILSKHVLTVKQKV